MKPEHVARLKDTLWRLNNLYYIKNKNGKRVKFKMTPEQYKYFTEEHSRNVILKARQLGFTTEVCIILLDAALFMGHKCALIAHTLPDAKRLFREKVKYAYDELPDIFKAANPLVLANTEEFVFTKGGSVTVSVSFRGGTLKRLHISEFGKIASKYPEKATEIITGALEAVSLDGIATIESTAEGDNQFKVISDTAEAMALAGKELSVLDFKFFFFSWFQNPEYSLPVIAQLPQRLQDYFADLKAKHGIKTTEEQQQWYYAKEKTLGDKMKREYPSTSAEAFHQAIEGAYYGKQMRDLREERRIGELPNNAHLPVWTFWDIGVGDSTSIWFLRQVGSEFHIIDHYSNSGEGLRHYMKVLKDRGYNYAGHVAPHDIDNREFGNDAISRREAAQRGYQIDGQHYSIRFHVVPRISVDDGIEAVREILPHCVFDEIKCADGIKSLENYRKEWDESKGCWKDRPLHDGTSHDADAFRYLAVFKTRRAKQSSGSSSSGYR